MISDDWTDWTIITSWTGWCANNLLYRWQVGNDWLTDPWHQLLGDAIASKNVKFWQCNITKCAVACRRPILVPIGIRDTVCNLQMRLAEWKCRMGPWDAITRLVSVNEHNVNTQRRTTVLHCPGKPLKIKGKQIKTESSKINVNYQHKEKSKCQLLKKASIQQLIMCPFQLLRTSRG